MILGALSGSASGIGNGLLITTRSRQRVHRHARDVDHHQRPRGQVVTSGNLVSVSIRSLHDPRPRHGVRDQLPGLRLVRVRAGLRLLALADRFGRYIYASGGNPEAARLSGVRVNVVRAADVRHLGPRGGHRRRDPRLARYRRRSGTPTRASSSTRSRRSSSAGRRCSAARARSGAACSARFFLQMIGNGFNLLGTTPEAQYVIKGVILAGAVSLDAWARRRRA